ncbi:diaminopimelate decarboxylase [Gloeocapsa sp. PCC 73106]|uniref:diaminopimelate decarboxylase n=1 Tax=Gloeocapsa sp. PCC 73106 TaxID=102232 RepID=UPI0002AC4C28|nr:diaminopimelate decarboxylase [Gloeocapsa sp. PCC 73106]ELR96373.1 diaminopimelate decarboxylase [Gloeocapsa sp. PCC 73106]
MVSIQAKILNSGADYLQYEQVSVNQCLLPITSEVDADGHLFIGGSEVTSLVARFGSPLYILDEVGLRKACQQYQEAFKQFYPGTAQVIYASKAWSCLAVCGIIATEGLGFDVVSGGELYTALRSLKELGLDPEGKIYFHGNNKSPEELRQGIESNCTIVVDNWWELEQLAQWSDQKIRIMLRLTPGIECHTHEYIRTGHLDSKFGFDPHDLKKLFEFVAGRSHLNCVGLHAHIGSQIFESQPHQDLAKLIVTWQKQALSYGLQIQELNLGGGLGIRYTEQDDPPSIQSWVELVCQGVIEACQDLGMSLPKLMVEPGRSLVGSSCVTAYRIGSSKTVPGIRSYVAVDGGMSDNPRPITYQSVYRCVVANRMTAPLTETVTVAGKHCESGDILIHNARLPKTEPGDVLVVMSTGAYNYSMASNYNRLPRPAAVLVNQGEANLILRRENYEDLLCQDLLPERLLESK